MKVGDYCYIKGVSRDYGIGKITQLNSGYSSNGGELIDIQFKHSKHSVPKIDVISSPNIIDLIEEKDIITYEYETSIGTITECNVTVLLSLLNELEENPNKYKIKSIVTKEQFESMEYKIGE